MSEEFLREQGLLFDFKDKPLKNRPFKSSGLIRDLAEFLGHGVPTHNSWCEDLACSLVGMMIGYDRFISNAYGKLRANIFVIYVGASGLSFKTVPLKNVVRPILKKLNDGINESILYSFGFTNEQYTEMHDEYKYMSSREKGSARGREIKKELDMLSEAMVDLYVPTTFTTEFMISHLSKHSWGLIPSDEYTQMFKGVNKKDYLSGVMEMLSRLYDCDLDKSGTISRGVEYPENTYVSFVSATTYYLLTLMTDDFFIQGTGNRILWIVDDEVQKVVDIEGELLKGNFLWNVGEDLTFDERLNYFTGMLMRIRQLPEGVVSFTPNAAIKMDAYRIAKFNQAADHFLKDVLDKDANLIARLAQNAMKLALIHCVGRYVSDDLFLYENGDRKRISEIVIDVEDVVWAIEQQEMHLEFYRRLKKIASRVMGTQTRNYIIDQERIYYWIDHYSSRGEGLTRPRLRAHTGWSVRDTNDILATMMENQQIDLQESTNLRGRRATYIIRGDHPTA